MELKFTAVRSGRLSAILKEDMGLSTGLMNRLKWQEKLFVNGVPRHTDHQVSEGDVITVPLEEETPEYPAEDGALTVLYEDEHILAVDKLPGMLIHPSRCQNTGTLANRVLGYYRKTGQKCAFHPITRLDRDTFGVVLLGKNSFAHAALMDRGQLEKTYHALVYGGPAEDAGTICAPIARRPLPSLLREIREDGKASVTEFTVLQREKDLCKLALKPVTGRTHQLRVHCSYMGYPVLGDPQYGSESSKNRSEELGLQHQLLCAKSIRFTHPVTGAKMEIISTMDVNIEV